MYKVGLDQPFFYLSCIFLLFYCVFSDLQFNYNSKDQNMSQDSGSQIAPDTVDTEKSHLYKGSGTKQDPFIVEFQKDDQSNPMNWGQVRKWLVTVIVTFSVFAVTFTSSAYSVSAKEIIPEFNISTVTFIAGVSVFVLGFAIGPAVWGPLVSFYFTYIYRF